MISGDKRKLYTRWETDWSWPFVNCIYDKELHRYRYSNNLSVNTHLVSSVSVWARAAPPRSADWRARWKTGGDRSDAGFMWNLSVRTLRRSDTTGSNLLLRNIFLINEPKTVYAVWCDLCHVQVWWIAYGPIGCRNGICVYFSSNHNQIHSILMARFIWIGFFSFSLSER